MHSQSIYNVNIQIIIDMTKLVTLSGINIRGSLTKLGRGESVVFPVTIRETTLRTTCTRLKNDTGIAYKVNRQQNGCHIVTRIS